MSVVVVLGTDATLVGEALERAGSDGDVVVLDPSAGNLEELERIVRDSRLWYQIGDAEVVPLPDRFADAALGGSSLDVDRVLR
jgi:ubiquinone/menaquinone biosynthesis C-methylase UbiE